MYYNASYCLRMYRIIRNGKTNANTNITMQNIKLVMEVGLDCWEYVKLKH